MDILSTAYKRAVQASIAADQSFELPLVTEENCEPSKFTCSSFRLNNMFAYVVKLCLGGIEGLSLNTKEIHRTFLANAPLEAKQIQLLSNSDRLLTMASEMEALSHRYYNALANQKVLVQSFAGQGKSVKAD
jgi:hypothetical protein